MSGPKSTLVMFIFRKKYLQTRKSVFNDLLMCMIHCPCLLLAWILFLYLLCLTFLCVQTQNLPIWLGKQALHWIAVSCWIKSCFSCIILFGPQNSRTLFSFSSWKVVLLTFFPAASVTVIVARPHCSHRSRQRWPFWPNTLVISPHAHADDRHGKQEAYTYYVFPACINVLFALKELKNSKHCSFSNWKVVSTFCRAIPILKVVLNFDLLWINFMTRALSNSS